MKCYNWSLYGVLVVLSVAKVCVRVPYAMCYVLCAVCYVLCAVCCVLCAVCCVLYADVCAVYVCAVCEGSRNFFNVSLL